MGKGLRFDGAYPKMLLPKCSPIPGERTRAGLDGYALDPMMSGLHFGNDFGLTFAGFLDSPLKGSLDQFLRGSLDYSFRGRLVLNYRVYQRSTLEINIAKILPYTW